MVNMRCVAVTTFWGAFAAAEEEKTSLLQMKTRSTGAASVMVVNEDDLDCTSGKCSPPTTTTTTTLEGSCIGFSCPANFVIIPTMDGCGKGTCEVGDCCEEEGTCEDFPCGTGFIQHVSDSTACGKARCSRADCCDREADCSDHTCSPGLELVADAGLCGATSCTDDQCCQTPTTTTTSTTTTTTKPVNPNANCDHIDCQKVCDGPVLDFTAANLVENTLIGQGWSGGGGTMKVADVVPGIDMYITDAKGNYDQSSTKWHRNYRNGEFMEKNTGMYEKAGVVHDVIRIAMEKTQDYKFRFQLKDKSGQPAKLEEFPLVFYDMDYYESVEACGVSGAVADVDTDLTSTWNGDCVTFKAGYKSADSPDDFDKPTRDQAKASAAFVYENTSEWTMTFGLKYYSHRWVLFKSSKALSCE